MAGGISPSQSPRKLARWLGDGLVLPCGGCGDLECAYCDRFHRLVERLEQEEQTASSLRIQLQRKDRVSEESADAWDTEASELHAENARLADAVRQLSRDNDALQERSNERRKQQLFAETTLEQNDLPANRQGQQGSSERFRYRDDDDDLQDEFHELKANTWELEQESDRLRRENSSLRHEILRLEHEFKEACDVNELERAHTNSLQLQVAMLEEALESASHRVSASHWDHGEDNHGAQDFFTQVLGSTASADGDRQPLSDPTGALREEVKHLREQLMSVELRLGADRSSKHLLHTVMELRHENRELKEAAIGSQADRRLRLCLERELLLALRQLGPGGCGGLRVA